MTRLQTYLPAGMHIRAYKHKPELTIIFLCAPNIFLLISLTPARRIYPFSALEFLIISLISAKQKVHFSLEMPPFSFFFHFFSPMSLSLCFVITMSLLCFVIQWKNCILIGQQLIEFKTNTYTNTKTHIHHCFVKVNRSVPILKSVAYLLIFVTLQLPMYEKLMNQTSNLGRVFSTSKLGWQLTIAFFSLNSKIDLCINLHLVGNERSNSKLNLAITNSKHKIDILTDLNLTKQSAVFNVCLKLDLKRKVSQLRYATI